MRTRNYTSITNTLYEDLHKQLDQLIILLDDSNHTKTVRDEIKYRVKKLKRRLGRAKCATKARSVQ